MVLSTKKPDAPADDLCYPMTLEIRVSEKTSTAMRP